jgi:hypothetical protein
MSFSAQAVTSSPDLSEQGHNDYSYEVSFSAKKSITNNVTMVKENDGAGDTPSTRTRRIRIALILSAFCLVSLYSIDESSSEWFMSSSDESSSQNRRQLISDNVWEAELRERQLRATGSNNNNKNKKQRVQIERKRMLVEDVASGEPSNNGKGQGRGPPLRYVSFLFRIIVLCASCSTYRPIIFLPDLLIVLIILHQNRRTSIVSKTAWGKPSQAVKTQLMLT